MRSPVVTPKGIQREMGGFEMRHLKVKGIFSLAVSIGMLAGTATAQSTPKKASIWQQMKDAAKQGAQQGQPQQQPQQQQPQPGQSPAQQRQRQPVPGRGQAGGPINDSGPFKPPAGTKIEETVLAPLQERATFEVSPHGVHVATTEADGSRAVVYYDGVKGPKFDEILPQVSSAHVVFSPDGNRYAYCARAGDHYVVMVDGKELVRSSEANSGRFDGESCHLGFTLNSKHVFWTSNVVLETRRGQMFKRFWFDGQPSPTGSVDAGAALSPDGNHYAYNLTISDPYHQDRFAFAVDGKIAPYMAGAPQWTADSKHLYTQRSAAPNGTELLFDGKPLMRAFGFTVYIPPAGDMVVVAVTGGTNFHPFSFLVINGKKVPGSDTVERGAITKVVFSPDGKHYAALCGDTNNHQYVIVDGKRGQEYVSIENLAFTADSSTVVYQSFMNGKQFIVVGEQEFGAALGGVQPPVIAPAGNRIAAFLFVNGVRHLLLDRKMTALSTRDADNLSFTPDGAHYAYFAVDAGMGRRLVIDGAPQPQSLLTTVDTMDLLNAQALKYVFSPDSKHIAHFAGPPTPTGGYDRGIFLDGKYVPASSQGTNSQLSFSSNSKHLFWIHGYGNQPYRVFIDGKPLVDFYSAGTVPHWWDFGLDGTLSFLAQDDNSLKRITITLSDTTSLATMLGSSNVVAANK
jgi:hypothetical protein